MSDNSMERNHGNGGEVSIDLLLSNISDTADGLARVLKQLPEFSCICVDAKIVWINDSGLVALAADRREDVVGKPFSSILPSEYAVLGDEILSMIQDEGKSTRTKICDLNGATWDGEISVMPDTLNGHDIDLVCIRDVTDTNRISESLHRREFHLRELLNNSLSMICECSDGLVTFVNKTGLKLLGAKLDSDVFGMPIEEVFHPDYQ